MSNTINLNGSFTVTANNFKSTATLTDSIITTGSNYFANAANVTASWQVLPQGSNSDFRIGAFTNTDTTSSVYIAINNTGSFTVLWPGDNNLLTFNTSASLYAKSSGSNPNVVLNYIVSEK